MSALIATKAVDLNAAAGCEFTAAQLASVGNVIEGDKCVVGLLVRLGAAMRERGTMARRADDVEGNVRPMGRHADDVEGYNGSSCGRCGSRTMVRRANIVDGGAPAMGQRADDVEAGQLIVLRTM